MNINFITLNSDYVEIPVDLLKSNRPDKVLGMSFLNGKMVEFTSEDITVNSNMYYDFGPAIGQMIERVPEDSTISVFKNLTGIYVGLICFYKNI